LDISVTSVGFVNEEGRKIKRAVVGQTITPYVRLKNLSKVNVNNGSYEIRVSGTGTSFSRMFRDTIRPKGSIMLYGNPIFLKQAKTIKVGGWGHIENDIHPDNNFKSSSFIVKKKATELNRQKKKSTPEPDLRIMKPDFTITTTTAANVDGKLKVLVTVKNIGLKAGVPIRINGEIITNRGADSIRFSLNKRLEKGPVRPGKKTVFRGWPRLGRDSLIRGARYRMGLTVVANDAEISLENNTIWINFNN